MKNRTVSSILDDLSSIDLQLDALKAERKVLADELIESVADEVSAQNRKNDYGTGTATIKADDYVLKVTLPKKIKWDNDALADIRQKIIADGAHPEEYMKAEYKVSETAYKNWPSHIRKAFEPARTVAIGAASFKYERKDDDA